MHSPPLAALSHVALLSLGGAPSAELAERGLIADGSYKAVLTKYNLQDNAAVGPIINGAAS